MSNFLDPITNLDSKPKSTVKMGGLDNLAFESTPERPYSPDRPYRTMDADLADKVFSKLDTPVEATGIDLKEQAAQSQSALEVWGKGFGQGLAEVVLGTAEGIGYLLDFEQYGTIAKDIANAGKEDYKEATQEYSNWFSSWVAEHKESLQEDVLGIIKTKDAEGFAPWDATWWGSNIKSVATSLSLMIPAVGTVRLLGLAGKLLGAGSKFLKGANAQKLTKGITGAIVSRYMENTMEAQQTYDEIFQKAKQMGLNDMKATEMASDGAASAWRANSAAIVLDLPQYIMMYRGFSDLANVATREAKKSIGRKIAEGIGQMGSEAIEESYQFMTNKEAVGKGLGQLDSVYGKGFGKRFENYVKDPEMWTSAWFGAIGGGVFSGAGSLARYISQGSDSSQEQKLRDNAQAMIGQLLGDETTYNIATDRSFTAQLIDAANRGRLDIVREEYQDASESNPKAAKYVKVIDEFHKNFNAIKKDGTLSKEEQIEKLALMAHKELFKVQQDEISSFIKETLGKLGDDYTSDQLAAYNNMLARDATDVLIERLKEKNENGIYDDRIKALENNRIKYDKATKDKNGNPLDTISTEYDEILLSKVFEAVDISSFIDHEINPAIDSITGRRKDRLTKKKQREEKQKLQAASSFESYDEFVDLFKDLSDNGKQELNTILNEKIKEQKEQAPALPENPTDKDIKNRYEGRDLLFRDELSKFNKKYDAKLSTVEDLIDFVFVKNRQDKIEEIKSNIKRSKERIQETKDEIEKVKASIPKMRESIQNIQYKNFNQETKDRFTDRKINQIRKAEELIESLNQVIKGIDITIGYLMKEGIEIHNVINNVEHIRHANTKAFNKQLLSEYRNRLRTLSNEDLNQEAIKVNEIIERYGKDVKEEMYKASSTIDISENHLSILNYAFLREQQIIDEYFARDNKIDPYEDDAAATEKYLESVFAGYKNINREDYTVNVNDNGTLKIRGIDYTIPSDIEELYDRKGNKNYVKEVTLIGPQGPVKFTDEIIIDQVIYITLLNEVTLDIVTPSLAKEFTELADNYVELFDITQIKDTIELGKRHNEIRDAIAALKQYIAQNEQVLGRAGLSKQDIAELLTNEKKAVSQLRAMNLVIKTELFHTKLPRFEVKEQNEKVKNEEPNRDAAETAFEAAKRTQQEKDSKRKNRAAREVQEKLLKQLQELDEAYQDIDDVEGYQADVEEIIRRNKAEEQEVEQDIEYEKVFEGINATPKQIKSITQGLDRYSKAQNVKRISRILGVNSIEALKLYNKLRPNEKETTQGRKEVQTSKVKAQKADIERRRELSFVNSLPIEQQISLNELKKIGILSDSLFGQQLFNLILNAANQFNIKVLFTNGVQELDSRAGGSFSSQTGVVTINLNALYESYQNMLQNKGRAGGKLLGVKGLTTFQSFIQYTITHELIHGVTQTVYNDVYTNTKKGKYKGQLNTVQVEAVQKIGQIFNYLKTLDANTYFGGQEYGLVNMSELMAEMSNEGFVSALQRIELPENLRYNSKNKNVFESIISFITDLFTGKKVKNNAADSLYSAISDIITTPQIQNFTEATFTQNSTETVQDKINAKYGAELKALKSPFSNEEVKETISEEIFNEFVNTGKVSDTILESIAKKVKQNAPLSKREQAIFNNNISKIEDILKKNFEELNKTVEEIGEQIDLQERQDEFFDSIRQETKEEVYEPVEEHAPIRTTLTNHHDRNTDVTSQPLTSPSLLQAEEMEMVKEDKYWITNVDETGKPIPSDKNTIGVDWNYLNKGGVKVGDTLHLEIDTNDRFESEGFMKRKVLFVKYIDGNRENKDLSNRKVVGMLKAYRGSGNEQLLDLRKAIDQELKGKIGVVTLDKTIRVDEVKPGRVRTDAIRDLTEIDMDVKLAVGVKLEGGTILKHNHKGIFVNSGTVNKGGVYILVPMADGSYTPHRLFTKKIKDVPEVKERIMSLLNNATENNWKDKLEQLRTIVYWEDIKDVSFTKGSGWNVKVENKIVKGLNGQQAYDLLNLDNRVSHLPLNDITSNGKKFANRYKTNLHLTEQVHSTKIGIDFNSFETQKETKPSSGKWNKPNVKIRRNPNKGGKSLLSIDTGQQVEKWNEEKELAWFKKKFPNVPISVLDNLREIHGYGGVKAWGVFKDGAVYISSDAAKGTPYHEGFHVIFNMFSTASEKKQLLKLSPEGTTLQKEEWLAERYKEYTITREMNPSWSQPIKDFFRKLWLTIKEVFMDPSLEDLFFKMSTKTYKTPISGSQRFTRFSSELGPKGVVKAVELVNRVLFTTTVADLREQYPTLSDSQIFRRVGVESLYLDVVSTLMEYEEGFPEGASKSFLNTLINELYDNRTGKLKPNLYERIKRGVDVYGYQFKQSLDDYADIELDENSEHYEGWQNVDMQISLKNRLSDKLKKYLTSIPKVKIDNEGYLDIVRDEFGFVDYHNPSYMYNYLQRELADSYSKKDMMEKLEKLTELKPELAIIYSDLVDDFQGSLRSELNIPTTQLPTGLDTHIYTQIAAKAHAEFIMITNKKNKVFNQYEGRNVTYNNFNVFPSNQASVRNVLIEDWKIEASKRNLKEPIDIKRLLYTEDFKEVQFILDQVGITMNEEESKAFIGLDDTDKSTVNDSLDLIIKQARANKNVFEEESSNLDNVVNVIKKTKPQYYQLGFRNVEGKVVYSHINSSFTTKQLKVLKDKLEEYRKDPFYENSFLLDELEERDMDFAILDGYRGNNVSNGIKYANMDKSTLAKVTINAWDFRGNEAYYSHQILSDSPTMVMFRWKKYTVEEAKDRLRSVYQQEVERNKNFSERQEVFKNYNKNNKNFFLLPFMDGKKENELDAQIEAYVEREINYLQEIGMIEMKDGKWVDAADNFSHNFNKDLKNNLRRFLINDLLMQSQIVSLFSGDPAFYKRDKYKASEKGTGEDRHTVAGAFYKRNKQTISPGMHLDTEAVYEDVKGNQHTISDEYRVGFIEDIDIETELNGRPFKEVLRENLIKTGVSKRDADEIIRLHYKSSSVTDAQGFIDIVRLRDIEIGAGRWDHRKEELYNKMINGEKFNDSVFNVFKPFYFGHITTHGRRVPIQVKNSEALLVPQVAAKNKIMREIMEHMGWEFSGNSWQYNPNARKIDALQTSETFKVGIHNVQPNDNIPALDFDYKEQADERKYVTLSNADYRIQLETPLHHIDHNNLLGTQIRKLIMADIEGSYNGVSAEEILKEYEAITVQDIEESFKELTEGENAPFNNKTELVKELIKEVEDRGLGEKYIEALEIVDTRTGETALPLWHPVHVYRIESLLTSFFTNRVIKQKAPGGVLINQTAWGWDKQPKIVFKENGALDHFEGYVPASFIFGKNIPEKYMTDGEPDIDKVLRDPNFDKSLLDIITYRIPTEDKYSMIKVKITGFTPEASGGTIILPPEITSIAGLDFDIDKVYAIKKDMDVTNGYYSVQNTNNTRRIELMEQVLSAPQTLEAIFNPNEFKELEGLADKLQRAEIDKGNRDLGLTYNSTRLKVFEQMMTGKSLVGVFANHNASHATMQNHNVKTKLPVLFDNKYDSTQDKPIGMSLSLKRNANGKRVSKVMASYLAASVDNGKNPVLGFLNINPLTADIAALINRVGYTEETASYFLTQPVVKKISEIYFKNGGGKKALSTALTEVRNMFKRAGIKNDVEVKEGDKSTFKYQNINTSDLIKHRDLELEKDIDFQHKVFKAFEMYQLMASHLSKTVQATRVDAMPTGPSTANTEAVIRSRELLLDKGESLLLSGLRDYLTFVNNPSMDSFYQKGFVEPLSILKEYVPFFEPDFIAVKNLLQEITLKETNQPLSSEQINTINNEYLRYLASDFGPFREHYSTILPRINSESRKKFIEKYPQFEPFFKFIGDVQTDSGIFVPIFRGASGLDHQDKDHISKIWEEMITNSNPEVSKMGQDLAAFSFHAGGLNVSPNGMGNLLPVSYFRSLMNEEGQSLNEFLENRIYHGDPSTAEVPSYITNFVDQYIKNNFNKLPFVDFVMTDEINIGKSKDEILILKDGVNKGRFIKRRTGDTSFDLFEKVGKYEYQKINTLGIRSKKGNVVSEYMFDNKGFNLPAEAIEQNITPTSGDLTIDNLIESSEDFELTADKKFYRHIPTGDLYTRVSDFVGNKIVETDENRQILKTAQDIGNGIDEFVRDFFKGNLQTFKNYPIFKNLKHYMELKKQLENIKASLPEGSKIVSNDIVLFDPVKKVAGTVDLIMVNSDGTYSILDLKTKTSLKYKDSFKYGKSDTEKWTDQVNAYRQMFTNLTSEKVKNIAILPVTVAYNSGSSFLTEAPKIEKSIKLSLRDVMNTKSSNKSSQYYEGNIKPEPNTVFVFGSNPLGINGNPSKGTGGAALVASTQFGVKQGEKMDNKLSDSRQAYGLTTVTGPGKKKSLTPAQIVENIKKLYKTAQTGNFNKRRQFKIAYRNTTERSLNGYTGLEMIEMFNQAGPIPPNVIFSKEWFDTGKLNKPTSAIQSSSDNLTFDDVSDDQADEVNKEC